MLKKTLTNMQQKIELANNQWESENDVNNLKRIEEIASINKCSAFNRLHQLAHRDLPVSINIEGPHQRQQFVSSQIDIHPTVRAAVLRFESRLQLLWRNKSVLVRVHLLHQILSVFLDRRVASVASSQSVSYRVH